MRPGGEFRGEGIETSLNDESGAIDRQKFEQGLAHQISLSYAAGDSDEDRRRASELFRKTEETSSLYGYLVQELRQRAEEFRAHGHEDRAQAMEKLAENMRQLQGHAYEDEEAADYLASIPSSGIM